MIVGQDVQALVDWAVGFQRSVRRAARAAHRRPPGTRDLSRRRLLRPRCEPRLARRRPRARRRGARHRLRGRGRYAARRLSRVRGHRLRSSSRASTSRASCSAPTRASSVGPMSKRALEAASDSGLIRAGEPLLVMLSGGADSVCLLDCAVRSGAQVLGSARELRAARGVRCRRGVLPARYASGSGAADGRAGDAARRGQPPGEARDRRYALAERHAPNGSDYASAHTASDQAETVLYRLAVSPGRRALLGMAPRRGRLVRPLLAVTREETRAYCRERGLDWVDDASNVDPRFARARVREEVLPVAARAQSGRRARHRRDEPAAARRGGGARGGSGRGHDAAGPKLAARSPSCAQLPPGLARLVLRRMAETAAGGSLTPSRATMPRRSCAWAIAAAAPRSTSAAACARWPSTERCASPASRTRRRPRRQAAPCLAAPASATGRWQPHWAAAARRDRGGRGRRRPHGPRLARGRPHAPRRPRRNQDAAGPLHGPKGPARPAPLPAGRERAKGRSSGWREWRSVRASRQRNGESEVVSLTARQV